MFSDANMDAENWCNSETSTCPIICQQTTNKKTLVNECNPVRY